MIILIRGTNGSGKSYVVREIIKQATLQTKSAIDLHHGSTLIALKQVHHPVFIVGPYVTGRSMGGSDCMKHSDIFRVIQDVLIRMDLHILVENVLISGKKFFGYHDAGENVHLCLIDPPLEICVERIKWRQSLNHRNARVSLTTMEMKQRRARAMFDEAQERGMPCHRTNDAVPMIRYITNLLRNT